MNTVPLFWNENLEPNISNYKIYAGPTPGGPYNFSGSPKNAGNNLVGTFDIPDNTSGYFRITAVNASAEESSFSVPEVAQIVLPAIRLVRSH